MDTDSLLRTDASCNRTVADQAQRTPLDWALLYAVTLMLRVVPLHSMRDGLCTCGRGDACPVKERAKHPRTLHGLKDATTDRKQIESWWSQWPDANVGIVTDGLCGLDVDVSDGKPGLESLRALEAKHGPLPRTLKVRTGSGGLHYYYRGDGRNSQAKLGQGIDTRGAGGYLIAPPSVHRCGGVYELIDAAEGDDPIAPAPAWLLARVRAKAPVGTTLDAEFDITREHCRVQEKALSRKTSADDQERRKLWRDLADGVPLCERGQDRAHRVALRVTGMIAQAYPTASPASVVSLLSPTWDESEAAELENAFTGACSKIVAEREEHAAALQVYEAAGLALGDQGKVLPTPANILKLARMDGKGLAECLRINVRGQRLEGRGLPWAPSEHWREWTDADDMRLVEWLQDNWEIFVGPERVRAPIASAASNHEVDPFQEYLEALPPWDRTPRAATWLTRVFGGDDTIYTRAISPKILLSIIARTYQPGCKVDCKPVLVGDQGLLKSSTWRVLVGPEFFADSASDPNEATKDRLARLHRAVLIEDQEMSTYTRADVNADKAFITTSVDMFRPPYGRSTGTYPRRFVLCGTSNALEGFLHDATGGRRYWPFKCERRADLEWLKANRDQLWAEALHIWADESRRVWWLSPEEESAAAVVQEEHRVSLAFEDALRERLSDPNVVVTYGHALGQVQNSVREGRVQAITTAAALVVLNVDPDRYEIEKPKVGNALRALGFKPRGRQRPRRYVAPGYRSTVPPNIGGTP